MAPPQATGGPDRGDGTSPATPPPSSSHPWDGFLTGPENELAFAGVQALARGGREGISPLVVHGPSGVGKSRLLAGLVAEWVRRHPRAAGAPPPAAALLPARPDPARPAPGRGGRAGRGPPPLPAR